VNVNVCEFVSTLVCVCELLYVGYMYRYLYIYLGVDELKLYLYLCEHICVLLCVCDLQCAFIIDY